MAKTIQCVKSKGKQTKALATYKAAPKGKKLLTTTATSVHCHNGKRTEKKLKTTAQLTSNGANLTTEASVTQKYKAGNGYVTTTQTIKREKKISNNQLLEMVAASQPPCWPNTAAAVPQLTYY